MKKREIHKRLITLIVIGLFIFSTSNSSVHAQSNVKNPNQIFVEYPSFSDPELPTSITMDLDPAITYNTASFGFEQLTYEGLVANDRNTPGSVVPVLAESWNTSTNGTVFTFNLRHNIQYQDGSPFNAYTMKYSFDRIILIDYGGSSAYLLTQLIVGAENFYGNQINMTNAKKYLKAGGITALDEFTLQIKLVHPFGPFLQILASIPPAISPHSIIANLPINYSVNQFEPIWGMISLQDEFPSLHDWSKLGLASNHNPAVSGIVPKAVPHYPSYNMWMASHMVGTGPYKEDSSSLTSISFIKNTAWHGTFTPNAPDKITYSEDTDVPTRISHFIQGDTDVLSLSGISGNQIFNLIDTNANSIIDETTAIKTTSASIILLLFNFNDSLTDYISPSNDINRTWNQTHISTDHLLKYSTNNSLLASINNPFSALKFREAFCYAFNYNEYLNEAYQNIFAIRPNGIITKGFEGYQDNLIVKNIIPDYNTTKAKLLFKEVGWYGNISLIDYNNYGIAHIADILLQNGINSLNIGIHINLINFNNTIPTESYPLTFIGNSPDYESSYGLVYSVIDSHGLYPRFWTFYDNPTIDQLMEQSASDPTYSARSNTFKNISLIAAHDYSSIYLAEPIEISIFHNWLHNFDTAGSQGPFDYVPKFQYISKFSVQLSSTISATLTSLNKRKILRICYF